jgi:hypothetical protein
MPWSVIPKFPEILKDLEVSGFKKEVGFETLKTSIMRVTGVMGDRTIANTISAMQRLGYIRMSTNGSRWEICKGKPYNFEKREELEEEIESVSDKYGLG